MRFVLNGHPVALAACHGHVLCLHEMQAVRLRNCKELGRNQERAATLRSIIIRNCIDDSLIAFSDGAGD